MKRPELAIRTLATSRPDVRLKIAGTGPLEPALRSLAAACGVADRVDFLGFVSDEDLLALYAGCRATLYLPRDEDYGYVPVESFFSRKPVITTSDAGGPLEFVTDTVNGFVRPPEPAAIAEAIDSLLALPEVKVREMGEEGRGRVAGIGWDMVVERLSGVAP